jgi:hypothetical protein
LLAGGAIDSISLLVVQFFVNDRVAAVVILVRLLVGIEGALGQYEEPCTKRVDVPPTTDWW